MNLKNLLLKKLQTQQEELDPYYVRLTNYPLSVLAKKVLILLRYWDLISQITILVIMSLLILVYVVINANFIYPFNKEWRISIWFCSNGLTPIRKLFSKQVTIYGSYMDSTRDFESNKSLLFKSKIHQVITIKKI